MLFYCPYCNNKLSFLDGSMIKMVGRLHAPNFSCKAMFYIPSELGKYGAIVGEGVRIKEGAKVEFECINHPCKRNFTTAYDSKLAEIKAVDEKGNEFVVVFNKIYGRRATFLVELKDRTLVSAFGEHADEDSPDFGKALNYFGD
jgi:hypothetical protein